jgi:hypothetical protein
MNRRILRWSILAALMTSSAAHADNGVPVCQAVAPPLAGTAALYGVAANETTGRIWVVGWQTAPDGTSQPLAALRTDGAWQLTSVPAVAGAQNVLEAVQWIDSTDALAVGATTFLDATFPCVKDSDCPIAATGFFTSGLCAASGFCQQLANYVLRWNGESWSIVDSGVHEGYGWELNGYPQRYDGRRRPATPLGRRWRHAPFQQRAGRAVGDPRSRHPRRRRNRLQRSAGE